MSMLPDTPTTVLQYSCTSVPSNTLAHVNQHATPHPPSGRGCWCEAHADGWGNAKGRQQALAQTPQTLSRNQGTAHRQVVGLGRARVALQDTDSTGCAGQKVQAAEAEAVKSVSLFVGQQGSNIACDSQGLAASAGVAHCCRQKG